MANYATVAEGDVYFSGRLDSESWDAASPDDKLRALTTATRLIDRLNYSGDKAEEDQVNEFPRDTDTEVPDSIVTACLEAAYSLLDGIDVELEARGIPMTGFGLSMVKNSVDVNIVNEWRVHGIPSMIAWSYLKPFLRDPGEMIISRVN